MVDFEQYDNLPKQEEMKYRFKKPSYWYYYDEFQRFKPKGNPLLREWYWQKGQKPHSHSWGRKPDWRMKRREQRREKRKNEMAQIIKFEKENCAPCAMVSNYLENEAQVEYKRLNPFNGGEAAELAAKYQIGFQVPVTVLVNDAGEKIDMVRGFNPDALQTLADQVK